MKSFFSYSYLEVDLASFQKKTPLKFSFLHLRHHNKVACLHKTTFLNFITYVQIILNAKHCRWAQKWIKQEYDHCNKKLPCNRATCEPEQIVVLTLRANLYLSDWDDGLIVDDYRSTAGCAVSRAFYDMITGRTTDGPTSATNAYLPLSWASNKHDWFDKNRMQATSSYYTTRVSATTTAELPYPASHSEPASAYIISP